MPSANRFGVATRPGKIYTFEIRPDVNDAQLLVDIGRTTYGMAFHPKFQDNGYFFVTSILDPARQPDPKGSRLSRYRANRDNRLAADASTEEVIFEWPAGGHNGGCIRFGPDGYLYLSTGDGSGIADELQTGQKIDDLLGAILRLDVDRPSEGKLYSIPADNPFVNRAGARPEIWSFGHRQVWKFSFDPPTNRLWAGEVGQDLWEMVWLIKKGGNYGWSVMEGIHPFRPERPKGPGDFEKPIVEHPHHDFRSITGGYVSHTDRLPEAPTSTATTTPANSGCSAIVVRSLREWKLRPRN
jgi:glucose/arabinose dehydrogenase